MIKISFNHNTMKQTKNILQAIALPEKNRALLLRRVAKNIVTVSKSNITKQQTPEGKKWEKRKKGRTKRKAKMLLGLRKQISIRSSNEKYAEVGLKKGNYRIHAGVIGKHHTKGNSRTVTADKNHYKKLKKNNDGDISRKQAKALVASRYKIPSVRMNPKAQKGKYRIPTIKWLMDNFSYEETRYAFMHLREEGILERSASWTMRTPSRRFLGADKEKTAKAWSRAFQSMKYGKRK